MDDLVVTVKHLLDELHVNKETCCRTNHLFQAESRQGLRDILENININNDMGDTDSTYQTTLWQLIDNVLSFNPPLMIDDSPGMATLADMDVVMEEDEDAGDSTDTLESCVLLLHEICGDDVINKADDLTEDAPPLPNAT